jgi:HD-like signal output (HDOD) protein
MVAVPPLSDLGQRLLALDASGRSDPRLLALLAQQDPVLLSRILVLANSSGVLPASANKTTNLDMAIRLLGATMTYSLMLGVAMGESLLGKMGDAKVRRFLTKSAFSRWHTARNLSRYLRLEHDQAFTVQMGALLEPLGVYAALLSMSDVAEKVRSAIEQAIERGEPACFQACGFTNYQEISAQVAAEWGAPPRVVQAMLPGESEDVALTDAVDALIEAKLQGSSQVEALVGALRGQPRWDSEPTSLEIDLASLDT